MRWGGFIRALAMDMARWADRIPLPGFAGLSAFEVFIFVRQEWLNDNIMTRANSMAFSFFLSLFPLIIVSITVSSYIPVASAESLLHFALGSILPPGTEELIERVTAELSNQNRNGIISVGFLLAIYYSSRGIINMMRGFDKRHLDSFKSRNVLEKWSVALLLTFILFVMAILSVVFIVSGNYLLAEIFGWLRLEAYVSVGLTFVKWIIILVLFYAFIGMIYRWAPAYKQKLPFFNPGTTFATVMSVLSSLALSYFVSHFGRYNEIYGSIAAIIILMLWLQVNSYILLIGFELNTSISVQKAQQASVRQESSR